MSEVLTQDRLQDISEQNLWFETFPGQFPAPQGVQEYGHFPQHLESFATRPLLAAAAEVASPAPQHGPNLGYVALTGIETGVQQAGGIAEAIAAIALGGARIPRSELPSRVPARRADFALAA